jgi:hypothetical protein
VSIVAVSVAEYILEKVTATYEGCALADVVVVVVPLLGNGVFVVRTVQQLLIQDFCELSSEGLDDAIAELRAFVVP